MKDNLRAYRAELQAKLEAVDSIIADIYFNKPVKTRERKERTGKRTMSPEGRARIAAAAKLRWKKAKAAGKNTL